MIEKAKILKIENAKQSMANLLMALNVKFAYDFGTFYILNTHSPEKFRSFCKKNGVSESELDSMVITAVEKEF